MPDEQIFRGTANELCQQFENNKIKGEFVVVIEGGRKKRKADLRIMSVECHE
jgi:16S rRNA C1402 (ribose-2'-O) methylase RsmI